MNQRILGLDIGIASIGWALVDYDKDNLTNNKIIKSGVRIFTIAENPKTGESLALPRRLARGARRTIKRKRKRLINIKNLFVKYLNISTNDIFLENNIYNDTNLKDVWQLRDKALKRKLTNNELARVLTHIAKRRGYKSNRKVQEQGDSEGKKVLNAIDENKKLLSSYLTIGQAIYQSTKQTKIRRNKKDDYNHSISRDMLTDEIKIIFEKQIEFGNNLSDEFKNKYMELFLNQIDFASVDNMVGTCTLEGKSEKRASKRAYSSEEFVTISKLINTKLIDENGNERSFTKDELTKVLDLCKQSEQPTYLKIRNAINLNHNTTFKILDYLQVDTKKNTGEFINPEKEKFKSAFIGFHTLRKRVEKSLSKIHWHNLSNDKELLNEIAKIFSYHKNDVTIREELIKLEFKSLNINEKDILINDLISNINFDKFLYLSIKAIEKLLVYMRDAKRYDEAVILCGYKKEQSNKNRLLRALNKDEMNTLTNPVVKRAISQVRKVVNAIIRKYGQFDKVHIELTRDIKKSHSDRNKILKSQNEYRDIKKDIFNKFIEDYARKPSGNELLKFRLLQEQDYKCIYSMQHIEPKKLLETGYVEIDHILPFSKSLEDGMFNKVLCLTKYNQDKKDRTPYEYFTQENKDWHKFEIFIKSLHLKKAKYTRLLKKNFDENSQKEFRLRNINDTAYMSRYIKSFIEDNLELTSKDKQKVSCINGTLTNMLRHNWGIGNKSRDNHLHHAVDAIIIAFATNSEVNRLSKLSSKLAEFAYKKSEEKAKLLQFKAPINNIRDEVQKSIDDIFVSFAPRKGVSGEAHEQTIYSPNDFKANKKLDKQLVLSGGSTIRNVKLNNNTKIAKQSSMPRIDIFKHKTTNKYYVVPIYTVDFIKNLLPNKAIVAGKNKDDSPKDWIEMDENYEFIFSIFKNELVEVKTKKEEFIGYFVSAHSGTGALELKSHNNISSDIFKRNSSNVCIKSIGIQNALYIKKYQVSPLGEKSEIKKEPRIGTKKQNKKDM